jgi:hypothetical protein
LSDRLQIPLFHRLLMLGVFGGAGGREVGRGQHRQGDVGVPGSIVADLVLVQAGSFFAVWKHSSIAHRAPATPTSSGTGVAAGPHRGGRAVRDPALRDGRGWVDGNVLGIACHGVLEDPAVVTALVGRPPRDDGKAFDELAAAVDDHLDPALLRRLTGGLL